MRTRSDKLTRFSLTHIFLLQSLFTVSCISNLFMVNASSSRPSSSSIATFLLQNLVLPRLSHFPIYPSTSRTIRFKCLYRTARKVTTELHKTVGPTLHYFHVRFSHFLDFLCSKLRFNLNPFSSIFHCKLFLNVYYIYI